MSTKEIFVELLFPRKEITLDNYWENIGKGYVLENGGIAGAVVPSGDRVYAYIRDGYDLENALAYPIEKKRYTSIFPERFYGVKPALNDELRKMKIEEDTVAILHTKPYYLLEKKDEKWNGGKARKVSFEPEPRTVA